MLTRHRRYCEGTAAGTGQMYAVAVGPNKVGAGSVGYWPREWRGEDVWETGWRVLPDSQGQGVATRATALVIEHAHAEATRQFMHAYPSVENLASNAICRKLGFVLLGAEAFEYPKGHWMQCNDWRLDLFAASSKATSD